MTSGTAVYVLQLYYKVGVHFLLHYTALITSVPFSCVTAAYEMQTWACGILFYFLRKETHECGQEGDEVSSSRHLL